MKNLLTIQCSMLPKLRLICFAHAGGGASIFHDWKGRLPASIEIYAVQLPARENRIRDVMPGDLSTLLEDNLQTIRPLLNKSYAFYGQSMGALLAFEMTRLLRRKKLPLPKQLFLAARRAPHLADQYDRIAQLADRQFINELDSRYGGMALVQANPVLRELSLPALRGDMVLAEQYQFVDEPKLDIPMHVLYGSHDQSLDAAAVVAWQQHTQSEFSLHAVNSGHFFDEAGRIRLWQLLSERLISNKNIKNDMNIGWQHG